jgi:foldase protein PrsA
MRKKAEIALSWRIRHQRVSGPGPYTSRLPVSFRRTTTAKLLLRVVNFGCTLPQFSAVSISGEVIMQDAPTIADSRKSPPTSGHRGGMLVGGTLLIVVAAGIAMQVWRAQDSHAAEQKKGTQAPVASDEILQTAMARVNGEAITYELLARECVTMHGKDVLDNLINRTIVRQACAERGLTVSEAEVDQEIVEISKKFGLAVDQWYKMLEAERGLKPEEYRQNVIWQMLALKKLAGKKVSITREMMQMAYEDNYGPRIKCRMMVLDNVRRATEMWDKVKANPDDFESLARDYSVEPNSRALGGTIPPIRKHSEGTHKELRKAAFAFKEIGEISGVLQVGPSQYVILKYEGKTEPIPHAVEDVQAQLHAELEEREVQKLVGETFESLQKTARVDNFITGETRGRVQQASQSKTIDTTEK